MKTIFIMAGLAACCLATSPAFAQTPGAITPPGQTASEDLQRAIFAQDAQGNIDGAIQVYRQVANSSFAPRDVSAHAQYRLSQALLQKGDLPAATRELERLEKAFPEYRTLIVNLTDSLRKASTPAAPAGVAVPLGGTVPVATIVAELSKPDFDAGPWVTVRGKISMVAWSNPSVYMIVESEGQRYAVILAAPNVVLNAGTITRNTFKLGETITIDARRPYQEPRVAEGIQGVRAETITKADGAVVFRR